jgi:hypothetical protein
MIEVTGTKTASYLRQNRNLDGLKELDVPRDAAPTTVLTNASRTVSDRKFMEYEGIAPFEDLNVTDAGVGYVRVHP